MGPHGLDQFVEQGQPSGVGRHHRAGNAQVAPGNGRQRITGLVHQPVEPLDPGTVLGRHHHPAALLHQPHELVRTAPHRTAGEQDAPGPGRGEGRARGCHGLQLGQKFAQHGGVGVGVGGEAAGLGDEHGVEAAQGHGGRPGGGEHLVQQPAHLVLDGDLLGQGGVGDGPAGALLQERLEPAHLSQPIGVLGRSHHGRQLHEMQRFYAAQKFVHLLLAVAGGLAHEQVRSREIRAGVGDGIAVARFDERAQTGRQGPFGGRDGFLLLAAKPHRHGSGRPHQLHRGIGAVQADHQGPGRPQRLDVGQKAVGQSVETIHDARAHRGLPRKMGRTGRHGGRSRHVTGQAAP